MILKDTKITSNVIQISNMSRVSTAANFFIIQWLKTIMYCLYTKMQVRWVVLLTRPG